MYMNRFLRSLLPALLSLSAQAGPVTVGNGIVSLSFDGETGALVSFLRSRAAFGRACSSPTWTETVWMKPLYFSEDRTAP